MRVTETTYMNNFLANLNQTRARIFDLQNKLSTGINVSKVSDDPHAANIIMRINSALSRNEQYQNNIQNASAMLTATGSALESIVDNLMALKEIVINAIDGSDDDMLEIHAENVNLILKDILSHANTKFQGKYIFGGTQTLTKPFELTPDGDEVIANPDGIDGLIEIMIGEGIKQASNVPGDDVFMGVQLFDLVIQIRDTLSGGNHPESEVLDDINSMIDHIFNKTQNVGSSIQTLESHKLILEEKQLQLKELRSDHRDTDFAEAILQLTMEETILQASLNVGAKLLPRSLLDFLR